MRQLLVFIALLYGISLKAETYNIKDFGAKGDGLTIDSPAINKAIDEANQNGGGTRHEILD